jgi:uncharacterized protein with HEPN domain
MSDRELRFYLDDLIRFAENALAYCDGLDQATFETTGLNYDATVRNMELIGEAATHIPYEIREAYISISRLQIIVARSRLIHGYLGIVIMLLHQNSFFKSPLPSPLQQARERKQG